MWVAVALIIAVVLAILVEVVLRRGGKPEPFAEGIANAQLATYGAIKRSYPDLGNDDLYSLVIGTHPGYSEEEARTMVAAAGRNVESGESTYFRIVVYLLVCHEFRKRNGSFPGPDHLGTITDVVWRVIPADL